MVARLKRRKKAIEPEVIPPYEGAYYDTPPKRRPKKKRVPVGKSKSKRARAERAAYMRKRRARARDLRGHSDEEYVDAILKSGGSKREIKKQLGIKKLETVKKRLNKNLRLQREFRKNKEFTTAVAEGNLLSRIMRDDWRATKFYLERRAGWHQRFGVTPEGDQRGILLVPNVMTIGDWAKAAKKQQTKLLEDQRGEYFGEDSGDEGDYFDGEYVDYLQDYKDSSGQAPEDLEEDIRELDFDDRPDGRLMVSRKFSNPD